MFTVCCGSLLDLEILLFVLSLRLYQIRLLAHYTTCTDMELETHTHTLQRVDVDRYVDPSADWQTGLWLQYSTLTRRNFWRQRRRYFSKLLFGQMLFLSVVTGVVWFNMKRTEDMARDRLGMVNTLLRSHYGCEFSENLIFPEIFLKLSEIFGYIS